MNRKLHLLLVVLAFAGAAFMYFGPETGAICMATVIAGSRATAGSQGVLSNTRVIDMSDTIHLLDPNAAPLTAVTMKMRKAKCFNPKFEWLEDDYIPTADTVSATAVTAAVTMAMNGITYFRTADVVQVLNTGEIVYVTAISGDNIIVTRSIGATAAAQLVPGDSVVVVGNANYEGSGKRTLKSMEKTTVFNYTQIFRWPFGATGTLQASKLYGGNDMTHQNRVAGLQHRIQMERSFLFGEKAANTGGATPVRYCDGVLARISTNETTISTTLTLATMETFLRTGFRYGSKTKILFASRKIVSYLNLIAAASIETLPTSKKFPLALAQYVSGHGNCYIVTHNLLEGAGTNEHYQGTALLLDMDSIFYRYLQGRDTKLRQNIQPNDEDGRTDEFISEAAPMIVTEKNHSFMDGVSAYA